jgi:hypothetical protein
MRIACRPAEVLPMVISVDQVPVATCANTRVPAPPNVCVRLVSGIGAKSDPRKLNASSATGISEEMVSNSGVVNPAGCVGKNSLRNL